MWDVIDIYSIHISRLFNSLHNKELIQGLIAQTFTIGKKEISNGTLLIKVYKKLKV